MQVPAGELRAHDQPAIEDVHGATAFPARSVARWGTRRGRVPRERRAQSGVGAGRDAGDDDRIGEEPAQDGLAVEVIELFDALPGTKALKFWAPPDAGRPAWSAAFDADRELVIASAFKAFVLAEYLRQAEETLDPTAAAPLAVQLGEQMQEELDSMRVSSRSAPPSSIPQT